MSNASKRSWLPVESKGRMSLRWDLDVHVGNGGCLKRERPKAIARGSRSSHREPDHALVA